MKIFRETLIILGIIAGILSIYLGAYLPYVKSASYIYFLKTSGEKTQGIQDLEVELDKVIMTYSPIGQEEAVRYIGNDILNVLLNVKNSEAIDRELVGYIEARVFKKEIRHILVMGEMYKVLYVKYGKQEKDYLAAENYYKEVLAMAPKFQPALYTLFDLYEISGNKSGMNEIGKQILKYWPSDTAVRDKLARLNS
jgi:tetratricopeptide (TPR) repeat protein